MDDRDKFNMPDGGESEEDSYPEYRHKDPFEEKEKLAAEEANIIEEINEPKSSYAPPAQEKNTGAGEEEPELDEDGYERKKGRRVTRSVRNRFIFGICGGLAEFFRVDPIVFRLLFIIAFAFTYWTVGVYLLMALLIPEPHPREVEEAEPEYFRSGFGKQSIITLILVIFGIYFFAEYMSYFDAFGMLSLLKEAAPPSLLILAAYYFYKHAPEEPYEEEDVPKKFYLSRENKMIGGVCGGLAAYFNMDPTLTRGLCIIFSILTLGLGAILYLIFLFVSPKSPEYASE